MGIYKGIVVLIKVVMLSESDCLDKLKKLFYFKKKMNILYKYLCKC